MNVLAIVPAFNEAASIESVVRSLRDLGVDVLVVDDGSGDDTADLARAAGATVAPLPVNLGIGGALQTGFRFALDRGYQHCFQFDADGQHSPREVATLLAPVQAGEVDLCIGSRFAAGEDPYSVSATRRGVMRLLARWVSRIVGRPMTDVSSGFRAFNRTALGLFAVKYPTDYMESVEALVIAAKAGLRITEVPVVMYEREHGMSSASSFRAALKTFRMAASVLLVRMFDSTPVA